MVVTPELRWQWKDEYHVERQQALGWMTREEATEIRAEGERVIARVEGRDAPFCEPWPDWRPDPAWPLPELSPDWARVQ